MKSTAFDMAMVAYRQNDMEVTGALYNPLWLNDLHMEE